MKVYQSNEIKNIALLGSKGSGKTTLAEAMLYECGVIKRRGSVEAQNTVTDYFPVEKEYGYSVFSTVFYAEFLNKKLNVIDCPGADDFIGGALLMFISFSVGSSVAYAIQFNPYAHLLGFLITAAITVLSGGLIYLFNLKISFRRLTWTLSEKRKAALLLAILTAPYLFLFPSIILYR